MSSGRFAIATSASPSRGASGELARDRLELERLVGRQRQCPPQPRLGDRDEPLAARDFRIDLGERRDRAQPFELGRLADLEKVLDPVEVAAAELPLALDRHQSLARSEHRIVGLGDLERGVEARHRDLRLRGVRDDLGEVDRRAHLAEVPDRLRQLDHRPRQLLLGRLEAGGELIEDVLEVGAVEQRWAARPPPRSDQGDLREGVRPRLGDTAGDLRAGFLDREKPRIAFERGRDRPLEVERRGTRRQGESGQACDHETDAPHWGTSFGVLPLTAR